MKGFSKGPSTALLRLCTFLVNEAGPPNLQKLEAPPVVAIHYRPLSNSRSLTCRFAMAAQPASDPPRPGPPPSPVSIAVPPSLGRFDVSAREYITRIGATLDGIAVGALVFSSRPRSDSGSVQRVLLIQRAETDSLPGKWEIPSGVVSNNIQKDATVTRAVVRELWEETGLIAKGLTRLVSPPHIGSEAAVASTPGGEQVGEGFVFSNSTNTKTFCRYVFEVEVEDEFEQGEGLSIKLNSWEHQDFVWAEEQEVRRLKVGDGERELDFTSDHLRRLILEGFRLRAEDKA